MRKPLVLLTLLFVFAFTAGESGETAPAEDVPHLIVSQVSGNLEMGRAGTIAVELKNNISAAVPSSSILGTKGSCLGIAALLRSRDERIKVISEPQFAGSLAPGENRSLEFVAKADQDMGAGIYPMELVLGYRRLSGVKSTGDIPDVLFRYESVEEVLPVEAKVSPGPRIRLEINDAATSGSKADLTAVFANMGDEPISGLQVQLLPQDPFRPISGMADLGDIGPGGSVSARFAVLTNNTDNGYYALPCRLSYKYGSSSRSEELAAIVEVKENSWNNLAVPAAAALLLAAAVFLGMKAWGGRKRLRRRTWR